MPISSRFVIRSTILFLGVGFFVLVGIVVATIWLGERARYSSGEVFAAREINAAATELRAAVQTAESSQRGFIITGNEIYLAPFGSAKARARRQLDLLKQSLSDSPAQMQVLSRLSAAVDEKLSELDSMIALKERGQDREAMVLLDTNRGKAVMDEINLFVSGIATPNDERLTAAVREQRANTDWLRWVSILGGIVIVLVVGGVTLVTMRYAKEVAQSRDEIAAINASLEERVKLRTADLSRARDRAEVLVKEVNHRVANSLAMVTSMVQLQERTLSDPAAKAALAEAKSRIYAIASVHKRLYTSTDARVVDLDEYLAAILDHLAKSNEGRGAKLRYVLEPLKLATDVSINLGVVVTELVTNAFKYAYPEGKGEVRVKLSTLPDNLVELTVEDDGVGRDAGSTKGTGLGTRIVQTMASSMEATIDYLKRAPGTTARLIFPLKQAA